MNTSLIIGIICLLLIGVVYVWVPGSVYTGSAILGLLSAIFLIRGILKARR